MYNSCSFNCFTEILLAIMCFRMSTLAEKIEILTNNRAQPVTKYALSDAVAF